MNNRVATIDSPTSLWILFNINRKGTPLYFSDGSKTNGQRWIPSQYQATPLDMDACRRLGPASNAIAVRTVWILKIKPLELAGLLRAAYRDAKAGTKIPGSMTSFIVPSRPDREPVERQDRNEAGGASPAPGCPS